MATKSSKSSRDHAALALEYARRIVDGSIPAGQWVVKAAKRHLDDLARSKSKAYPFKFDADKGARVCRFIEFLPHTKGKWGQKGERLVLQPWQCFLVTTLFGWLRKASGKRRFRYAYWEIPRKNGKSPLAAAIGNYMLLGDGEFGAEVYCGAPTERQAWEVFKPARLMLQSTPDLCDALGATVWAKALVCERKNGKFQPVIGNPGDGASPSCAIIDEYHEHQTPVQHDTMQTGMGAREQPLMLVITTAGFNIAGPCHEKHDEVRKVLDGIVENNELFGCIYGIDADDDWADPKVLQKANPNFGVSVDADFLLSQQRQAMQNPIQQATFKTKHLGVWVSVMSGWMNMQQWTLAADPLLDEDELIGEDCWMAIDLASKSDLCAEQRLYRRYSHGQPHYYLFGRYWLPEAAIEEAGPNHAHYAKWVRKGLLTQTEGATVDFEQVTQTVVEDCKRFKPIEVIYDPFNATQMSQALMAQGIEVVEFIQQPQNFAVPMDELLTAVKDGRFHHDGNEMTTWCVSNVVARPAKKGLFSPIKAKPHQKIDGAIAAIMSISRAAAQDTAEDLSGFLSNPIIS
jgi:phage terminase large subunit-like protein